MNRTHWKTIVGTTLIVGTMASLAWANLLPDANFKKADLEPKAYQGTWRWFKIVAPAEAKKVEGKNGIELTGGKVFLHSSRFPVAAGKTYEIGLTAKGTGVVSVEVLWWQDNGGMTEPHRTIPVVPTPIDDETQSLNAVAIAPEGAAQAYIRIVVEDGSIVVTQPSVTDVK